MPRVFVSYVFEDRTFYDQVVDWARRKLLGEIHPVTETHDVRRYGDEMVYAHLRTQMRAADALLVLVGQDTHDRRWVDAEVHYFATAGRPIVAARIPNTTGGLPPEIRAQALIPFSPDSLFQAFSRHPLVR